MATKVSCALESTSTATSTSTVLLLPRGFSFGEICAAPKLMPTAVLEDPRRGPFECHVLHTGSFVRIATMPGRLYWMAQNATGHVAPDWKLHVAVRPADMATAWDHCVLPCLLRHPIFLRCGMKAVLVADRSASDQHQFEIKAAPQTWDQQQTGRELTVYLFQPSPQIAESLVTSRQKHRLSGSPEKLRRYWVGDHADLLDHWYKLRHGMQFSGSELVSFIRDLQASLESAGVRCSGLADGDLSLTSFISLRNEAYTSEQSWCSTRSEATADRLEYPRNAWGWNASRQQIPNSIRHCMRHFTGQVLSPGLLRPRCSSTLCGHSATATVPAAAALVAVLLVASIVYLLG